MRRLLAICAAVLAGCDALGIDLPDLDLGGDAGADGSIDASTDAPPSPAADPAGWIGSPCTSDRDCDFDDGVCLTEADGFPAGMCTAPCDDLCPDRDGFPVTFCPDTAAAGGSWCHSRCDFGVFPGSGCREGYACRVAERASDPSVAVGTCVLDGGDGPDPLSDCVRWLADAGVPFEPTVWEPRSPEGHPELTCEIEDPVRLRSPAAGVRYRSASDDEGDYDAFTVACPMARALVEMAGVLADYDIDEVVHFGTVNCRTIRDTDRLSQHGLGLAIDIAGFVDVRGRWYGVEDHWEHDTDDPRGFEARVLYEIAHRFVDEGVFNIVLTPNYNDAHDDNFHVDLTAGQHFLGRTLPGDAAAADDD